MNDPLGYFLTWPRTALGCRVMAGGGSSIGAVGSFPGLC